MAGRHLPRLNTPGRSTFKGAVRQGLDTGVPDTISIGEAVFTQRAELSAAETSATTVFVLPSDNEGGGMASDIIEIKALVDVAFDNSAQALLQLTYGSAAGTALGEVRLSGASTYTVVPGSSAVDWMAVAGGPILAKVSSAVTINTGHAYLLLEYVPR